MTESLKSVRLPAARGAAWFWRASGVVSVGAGVLLWPAPGCRAVAIALVLGVYALIASGLWPAAVWRGSAAHTASRAAGRGRDRRPVPRAAH